MTDYDPRLWGDSGWTFLEYIALGYPDKPTNEDNEHYKQLYKSLEFTIPCKECRKNYKLHIIETPIENYLKNSSSLYEWVIIMRNKVNRLLGMSSKNYEKSRTTKMKRNISLNNNTSCCGKVNKIRPRDKLRNLNKL